MILQNSFLILFFITCFQKAIQNNFNQNVNKNSTSKFQKDRGNTKVSKALNNTIYFNKILHSLDFNNYSIEIEKDFKNIMAMHGVKYIYKRDFYWRTWRHTTREDNIIFFKSQSIYPRNCTKCHVGYWVIEEKPPLCQYEILSLKSVQDVCVFTPRDMVNERCPKIVPVRNFIHECGNPVKTKLRITYKYDISERNTVICQGRELCEITTSYSIHPDFIVFQIINSTNHVIYSRIMKDAYRNYIYTSNNVKLNSVKENKKDKIKGYDKSKKINTGCFNIKDDYTEKLLPPNGLNYKVYNTKSDSKIIQIFYETRDKLSPCKKLQLMQKLNEENEND